MYPLPQIDDLVEQLQGARVFSKLDLQSGYNNIHVKDGDQWKVAFKTKQGLFKLTVMFFGLCNSLAMFQVIINEMFKEEVNEGWLGIYIDNMILYSSDLSTHHTHTRRVLEKL